MSTVTRLAGGLASIVTVVMSQCQGAAPAPPTARTLIGGDSLTFTTAFDGHLAGLDVVSGLGWQAHQVLDGTDRDKGVADYVTDPARSPGTMVIALGQNDARYDGGWTGTDVDSMTALATAPHPDTCVAWVAPWYTGTDAAHRRGIDDYRAWLFAYANEHGQTVVDWRPHAVPEHMDPDGIHLTAQGRARYGAVLREAAATC